MGGEIYHSTAGKTIHVLAYRTAHGTMGEEGGRGFAHIIPVYVACDILFAHRGRPCVSCFALPRPARLLDLRNFSNNELVELPEDTFTDLPELAEL